MKPSTEFTASGQGHPNYQLYVNPLQTIMAQTAQTAAYGGNPFTGDNNQGASALGPGNEQDENIALYGNAAAFAGNNNHGTGHAQLANLDNNNQDARALGLGHQQDQNFPYFDHPFAGHGPHGPGYAQPANPENNNQGMLGPNFPLYGDPFVNRNNLGLGRAEPQAPNPVLHGNEVPGDNNQDAGPPGLANTPVESFAPATINPIFLDKNAIGQPGPPPTSSNRTGKTVNTQRTAGGTKVTSASSAKRRDEAAHSNARGNLVKMNNLLGTEAREFSSFVGILETVARGKWWFTAHGEKFDFSGLADGSVDKYTFEDVHGAVENRIEDKMGSFALSSRFGFTDTENIEAVYENAVTNLISDQYAHAVYPAGHPLMERLRTRQAEIGGKPMKPVGNEFGFRHSDVVIHFSNRNLQDAAMKVITAFPARAVYQVFHAGSTHGLHIVAVPTAFLYLALVRILKGEPQDQRFSTSGERGRNRDLFYKKLGLINSRIGIISSNTHDESLTLHYISQQIYTRAASYSGVTNLTKDGKPYEINSAHDPYHQANHHSRA